MTKEQKAHKILAEGRLQVERIDHDRGVIVASCRGLSDGNVYALGYRADRDKWGCTCEASRDFHRVCSHLVALQLVTVKPTRRGNG